MLYALLGIKVFFFYKLVDFKGIQYVVALLTLLFFVVVIENIRRWKKKRFAQITFGILYSLTSMRALRRHVPQGRRALQGRGRPINLRDHGKILPRHCV